MNFKQKIIESTFDCRCPKYPNLPPNWQLVKSPGECCPHVVIGVGEREFSFNDIIYID